MHFSAAEAILPAIRRTWAFLFRPFHPGAYLKLCLVALLTEGLGVNSNFGHAGGHHRVSVESAAYRPFHFRPEWIPALIVIVALMAVVGLVLFYLITRLRFAYFHCLIHNIREIRPGWRLYRAQATRFFWLNLGVGICFLLLAGIIALPFVEGFWRLVRETNAGGHANLGSILALVLPLIPVFILLVLAGFSADIILRDFMLPHYALENATAGDAWTAVWERIRMQKGSFFAYALLRIVLPIVGVIALFAVLVIPGIVFLVVVTIAEVGIHAAFAGGPAAGAGILLEVLVGTIAFIVALLVWIAFGGPLSTAIREYALLFYGVRYQPLGDLLFPPPPIAPPAPTLA